MIKKIYLILFFILMPATLAENNNILIGTVVDSLNNLVEDSDVKVQCNSEVFSTKTDKFGTFYFANLPEGSCNVHARFSNAVGFTNVIIKSNEINEVNIALDKTIISLEKENSKIYYLISILVALIFFLFLYMNKRLKNRKFSKEKINILLKGLSDKERQIIEYLIAQKGHSSQAKIFYNTKIPKASLSRHIKSLEAKKIIKIESLGKLKKIELIDKF